MILSHDCRSILFWCPTVARLNDLVACRSWSLKRGEVKQLELIGMTAAAEGSLWPTADSFRCAGEGKFRGLPQDVGQQGGGGRGRGEEGGGIRWSFHCISVSFMLSRGVRNGCDSSHDSLQHAGRFERSLSLG